MAGSQRLGVASSCLGGRAPSVCSSLLEESIEGTKGHPGASCSSSLRKALRTSLWLEQVWGPGKGRVGHVLQEASRGGALVEPTGDCFLSLLWLD